MGFGRRYTGSLHYSWFCVCCSASRDFTCGSSTGLNSLPASWQGLIQSSSVQLWQENFCLRYPFYLSSLIHASQRPIRNLFSPFIWEVKHGTEDDAFLPWQYRVVKEPHDPFHGTQLRLPALPSHVSRLPAFPQTWRRAWISPACSKQMEPILYWSRVLAFSFATIYWTVYSGSLFPLDTFPVPLLSTLEQVGADVLTWMTSVLLRVLQLVHG